MRPLLSAGDQDASGPYADVVVRRIVERLCATNPGTCRQRGVGQDLDRRRDGVDQRDRCFVSAYVVQTPARAPVAALIADADHPLDDPGRARDLVWLSLHVRGLGSSGLRAP